ncbi:MAG: hypothetical protein CFE46_17405 [Burkholderiales bacterium PBB6]|nr:MAG: hypothetical protein CFE46_17405 [Burkholderiales bacterium PBB6]
MTVSGVPSPLRSTVTAVTVSVSPSASVSLPSTLPDTGVSSVTLTVSSFATGASLTGVTVMSSVAVVPPVVVYVIGGTAPWKSGAGVKA